MSLTKHTGWIITAILSVASSVWYFTHAPHSIKITLDEQTLSTAIDTIVTELSVQQFDVEGRLIHSLQTPLMQHIPKNNTHLLTTPHIVVKESNQAPWEIRSETATALYGGKQITFNNNVIVHQKKYKQTEETTLTTDEITYFPKNKLATTSKEVTLKQANNQMQSTGMKAYLAENRVQLLGNARGHYEPQHG
ncbi:MAG: LPS export ABC transporter periplasmic protein LptC [Legionellaceae bacterium]|nr:LPS export ABC transporter periplasmic protein LptC [Legionellaceae bacterium]